MGAWGSVGQLSRSCGGIGRHKQARGGGRWLGPPVVNAKTRPSHRWGGSKRQGKREPAPGTLSAPMLGRTGDEAARNTHLEKWGG